ncbi:MAG: lysine-2,3-aminomutase-like protein [Pseudomonadota bacterium]
MNHKKPSTLRRGKHLVEAKLITSEQQTTIEKVVQQFDIAITPNVLETIQTHGDAVYRQYVPSADELTHTDTDSADPIGDLRHSKVKGIIHRYPDRCLLLPINSCAVYCRFCFRREKIGKGNPALTKKELTQALQYIADNKQIWEVILTGGDPLILKANALHPIMDQLSKIDHVKVVRLHTRVPVVDPRRVDQKMVQTLKIANKAVYVILHANHPQEFTSAAEQACALLIDAGIPMLSQSTLLHGINDNAEVLAQLMRKFVSLRIKPYYLHHTDLAKGTGHFRTSIAKGQQLLKQLRGRYSGLCQPHYVLDIPGGYGKVPIGPQYITTDCEHHDDNAYIVKDYQDGLHNYPPKNK